MIIELLELFDQAVKHHVVHGLYEFDVTKIMKFINEQNKKGKIFSFTGYVIYCLAQATQEFEIINSAKS